MDGYNKTTRDLMKLQETCLTEEIRKRYWISKGCLMYIQ